MRPSLRVAALAAVSALGIARLLGQSGIARAQEGPAVARSARGGILARGGPYQFEVFFYPTGLRLFPLDRTGRPLDASRLTGTAIFYHPNLAKPWFTRPLRVTTTSAGQHGSLELSIGLGSVPARGANVTLEIAGLPESGEPAAAISVPVEFTAAPSGSSPAPPPQAATSGPRYLYGPGYYGFGYYQHPGPQSPAASSAPTVFGYGSPGGQGTSASSGSAHDWSTGRDFPSGGLISKPWLRPMD